jgi:hypothetical protein
MKLSAAIRIGSMTTKQIKGNYSDGGNGRCALGAALDAAGIRVDNSVFIGRRLIEVFPIVIKPVKSPVGSNIFQELGPNVSTLNDDWGWSRERIADWVEEQENAMEATMEAPKHEPANTLSEVQQVPASC